jgi:drug/metabolite transporter (DMT)-like permease
MNPPAATAGLGLLSASSWGGSDFLGGLGSRRAPTLLVVASGHLVSLIVLAAVCLAAHLALPGHHDLLLAAIGGFEGAIALALFYRALAMGAMGLTAALTGLLTALVPVLFSLLREGLPTIPAAMGLVLGLAAIVLITYAPTRSAAHTRTALPRAALLLGAIAGLGFGTQLILFKMAASGSVLWTMTAARAAGVAAILLVILVMPPKAPWRGFWFFGVLAGSLDTVGNLLYIETTRIGRLDVAAVICSLYPAVTILLAALALREWPTPRQFAGMALALMAVSLLSL